MFFIVSEVITALMHCTKFLALVVVKTDVYKWRWNEEEIFGQELLEVKVSILPSSKITEHRMVI